ncbi:dicarboxylate/amino acid:cation symporter [Shewanella eurypsychrophilus]|uniref:Dicarboxylate/amino acid:cation symporter n=1 Tax=Shewanella eurypsychrophilus TaxID=2593656 RepID=A0ABX6V890_9GAMM|nr:MULTISPECIES: dicarboxylate/amino acid:cation symporter [Shewanella]QFU23635.1 cation:dicarboxylase symporter family transporter [Shewanella sp. YLB-09]QPG58857.1 dicarboxylate/amino acid:cation symporter [Shewanella eurypsychrophilus]
MFKSLSSRIFVGLFAGLLLGTIIQYGFAGSSFANTTLVDIASGAGSMFVQLIMMLVVPLVFFSIVTGIVELRDLKSFGRLGSKTFALYLANTVVAIIVSIGLAMWIAPGAGMQLVGDQNASLTSTELPGFIDMIVNIIPSNPVDAFATGNMLQIIFMALLTGGIVKALGDEVKPVVTFFQLGNKIMLKMITVVMSVAPIGVFALMVKLGATFEPEAFLSVFSYMAVIVGLLAFWALVVYPMVIGMTTNISASEFRRKTREQFLFSLSTASSNATIPVTMRTLTEKLGVKRSVAGFGVPMGATMNMSGAAIYITVAAFFVGNAFGAPITMEQVPVLAFSVFLLSIGAGGVPGGGIVMIGVLIHQMGLPVEAIALVAALDRIIDMFCTSTNVVGDSAVVTMVDHSEKAEEAKLGEPVKA